MVNCDNCTKEFTAFTDETLHIRQGQDMIVNICSDCTTGVLKAKLVVVRKDTGQFAYEQYQPLVNKR